MKRKNLDPLQRNKILRHVAVLSASNDGQEGANNETISNSLDESINSNNQTEDLFNCESSFLMESSSSANPIRSTPFYETDMDEEKTLPVPSEISNLFSEEVDWNENEDLLNESNENISTDNENYGLPLYSSASNFSNSVSVDDYCRRLLLLQRKNRISDTAMDDICKLFKRLLPSPNNCPANFSVIRRKTHQRIEHEIGRICSEIVWLCGKCHKKYDNRKDSLTCCHETGQIKKPAGFFKCDIEKQIRLVIENHGVRILKFLKETAVFCSTSSSIRDMTSGEYYRNNVLPNPKQDNLKIHLLINADGAKFTKSKTGSFWPIDAQIVELPPKMRVKFENSILFALWQGESKPDWNIVLANVIEELRLLSQSGFSIRIQEHFYRVTIHVLATVFDLPACSSIWNTVQWNGKQATLQTLKQCILVLAGNHGCMHCKDPGIFLNRRRIWPRTKDCETKDSAFWQLALQKIATDVPTPYFGVKGRSILFDLNIDPHLQNPLDFMHQAYEGVVDKVLDALFGKLLFLQGLALIVSTTKNRGRILRRTSPNVRIIKRVHNSYTFR